MTIPTEPPDEHDPESREGLVVREDLRNIAIIAHVDQIGRAHV